MIEQMRIDNSIIHFTQPRYHFGQKVQIRKDEVGCIIGAVREKYSWSYLIVEGSVLSGKSIEKWYQEPDLTEA